MCKAASVDFRVNLRAANTTKAAHLQAQSAGKIHGTGTDQMFDSIRHEQVQCLKCNTLLPAAGLSHHNLHQAILLSSALANCYKNTWLLDSAAAARLFCVLLKPSVMMC